MPVNVYMWLQSGGSLNLNLGIIMFVPLIPKYSKLKIISFITLQACLVQPNKAT